MKKLFTLIMVIFLTFSAFSQSPEKMSYQCVVRNAGGALVTNQSVALRISILQGTTAGTVVYSETYNPNPQTNINGLVTVEIGGGVPVTGSLSDIDWASGPYFLKTETDPAGGTNYSIVGTSQLLSVPYALYARTAENGSLWSKSDPDIYFNAGKVGIGTSNPSTYIHGHGSPIASRGQLSLSSPAGQDIFLSFYEASTFKSYLWFNVANQDLRLQNFTAGNLDLNPYGGKVGIGTLSPTTALDVNGIITAGGGTFSNDLSVNGLTVGRGTASVSTNVAVGTDVLSSNTTGGFNTAIGYQALYSNTTGNGNTASGRQALYSNSTGTSNVAIGMNTLSANTTGLNNIAIGTQSLGFNNGNGNVAIGWNAAISSTAGYYNTAIGEHALGLNTTGSTNTAIGREALRDNTTGSNNIAIGLIAGVFNMTGSNNIAIGNSSTMGQTNLQNSVVIGSSAGVSESNTFVLGNSSIIGWGFGVNPGVAAIRVGSSTNNGNGATLTKTGVWTNASDISKKYDIENISYGINEVMKLRPVSYKLKGLDNEDIGFIAQEVKKIVPEIIYGEEGQMTMSYGQLTSVLVKAVQEQQKQIEELKALVISLISNQTVQVNN
jgi:hypothetical protein